jgi:glycosyltransferase involved in cell wall biosynthesis
LKKKKVIFVINEYSFFISHRKKLIESLGEDFNITVITDLSDCSEGDISNSSLYKLEHLDKKKHLTNPRKFYLGLKNLLHLIKRYDPDFIFYVSMENCVIGSILLRFTEAKKSFFLITGIESFLKITSLKRFFVKLSFSVFLTFGIKKNKSCFIFQNKDDLRDIKNSLYRKMKEYLIIPGNGIDQIYYEYRNRSFDKKSLPIKILFASRLLTGKGINEFFIAANELGEQLDNIEFFIAGSYEPNNKLSISEQDFQKIQKSDYVQYLGNIKNQDMKNLYLSYDIFILPSYREGLPASALEAAATGMPLILSDVPGCRECVADGKNGFLIQPKSIGSIKGAIIKMHKNSHLIAAFSAESRSLIEKKFTVSIISNSYKQLIT